MKKKQVVLPILMLIMCVACTVFVYAAPPKANTKDKNTEAAEPAAETKTEEEPVPDNVIDISGLISSVTDKDGKLDINGLAEDLGIDRLLDGLTDEEGKLDVKGLAENLGIDKLISGVTDEDGKLDLSGLAEDLGIDKLLSGLTDEDGDLNINGLLGSLGFGTSQNIPSMDDVSAKLDYMVTFPSWDPDSAALAELVAFVNECTDEASPNYLAPEDRLATFDMDGTILCEKAPVYIDYCLTMYRVLDDPTFKATEEERDAMQQIRDVAYSEGKTFHPETITKADLVASAFAGMTPEEFREYVVNFAYNTDVVGFDGMTYGESFYKPMLEVIAYLKANDFDVWMVSACEREVVRALVDRFDIPFDHVIATDVPYVASKKGDEPADEYNMGSDEVILLGAPLDPVECGKSGKSAAIAREIGKRPVLAFGNSSGDYSMLNYAEGNPYHEGKGFFVVCDDTVREYGSDEKAAEYYDEVKSQGWTAISMANDWTDIYGEDVVKTELPGAKEAVQQAA